jgi:hypothetical protein
LEPYFVGVADKIVAAAVVVQVNIEFVMEVVDTDVSGVVAAVVYEILVEKNKNLLLLLLVAVLGVAVAVSNLGVAAAVVVGDGVVVDGVEYNVDIRLEILVLDFRNNNPHDTAVEDVEKLVVNILIAAVVYSVDVTVDDNLIEQLQVLDNNVVVVGAAAVVDDVNLFVDKLAQIQ